MDLEAGLRARPGWPRNPDTPPGRRRSRRQRPARTPTCAPAGSREGIGHAPPMRQPTSQGRSDCAQGDVVQHEDARGRRPVGQCAREQAAAVPAMRVVRRRTCGQMLVSRLDWLDWLDWLGWLGWLVGWLDWLGWLGWLDWLVGWLVGWIGWWVGWFVGWLNCRQGSSNLENRRPPGTSNAAMAGGSRQAQCIRRRWCLLAGCQL